MECKVEKRTRGGAYGQFLDKNLNDANDTSDTFVKNGNCFKKVVVVPVFSG